MKKVLLKKNVINKNNFKINKLTTILIAIKLVSTDDISVKNSSDFYGNDDFIIKDYLNLLGGIKND